jgi:hypothetical protein
MDFQGRLKAAGLVDSRGKDLVSEGMPFHRTLIDGAACTARGDERKRQPPTQAVLEAKLARAVAVSDAVTRSIRSQEYP